MSALDINVTVRLEAPDLVAALLRLADAWGHGFAPGQGTLPSTAPQARSAPSATQGGSHVATVQDDQTECGAGVGNDPLPAKGAATAPQPPALAAADHRAAFLDVSSLAVPSGPPSPAPDITNPGAGAFSGMTPEQEEAPPVAAKSGDPPLWTFQRLAVARRGCEIRTPVNVIQSRINQLPGRAVTTTEISDVARRNSWPAPAAAIPDAPAASQADGPSMEELPCWSADRDAILKRDYPAGLTVANILAALNDAPGPSILAKHLWSRVTSLKLKRPEGTISTNAAAMIAARHGTAKQKDPAPALSAPVRQALREVSQVRFEDPLPIRRTRAEIVKWCAVAKCNAEPFNLDRINGYRATMRLAPFELVDDRAPAPTAALPPVKIDYEGALRWANERGLCTDGKLDLEVVNAKRNELGLPPYAVSTPSWVAA